MYFIFDEIDSTNYDLTLHNYSYSVMPGTIDRFTRMPGRRGVFDHGTEIKEGYFTLDLSVNEDTLQDTFELVELIAKWLNPENGVKEMTFSDRPGRTWNARLVGSFPVDHIIRFARFSLTFVVPDGVAEGMTKFSTGTSVNAGAVECPVKITATFTADEASDLTISDGTDSIIIDGPFTNGDVLVMENGYVTLNDANNMANVQVSSVFFKLPVGDFAVTSDSVNAGLVLEWTELWL